VGQKGFKSDIYAWLFEMLQLYKGCLLAASQRAHEGSNLMEKKQSQNLWSLH
jgi:hypothetical protein